MEKRARHHSPLRRRIYTPNPGTRQWSRSQAVLSVFRATQNAIYALAHNFHLNSDWRERGLVDESVFTLFNEEEDTERRFASG